MQITYHQGNKPQEEEIPGQSSAAASFQMDDLANPPSPASEGKILNSLVILFYLNADHIFTL